VCISAWLFTIGFLYLTFWKGMLAIVLWPYYLGVQFQRAGALSTSRSGQYQALAICSRGVNYGVGVGAAFLCYFRVEQPAIATKTNLWPRIFDALCHEAIHVSTTQPDSAIPLPPSILLAAQRHSWAGLSGLPALRDRV